VHAGGVCGPLSARTIPHGAYSLGKLFKGAGFATGAFGKWNLGPNLVAGWEIGPQLHGFEAWRAGLPDNVSSPMCGGSDYEDWTRVDDGVVGTSSEYQSHAVRDEFLRWWKGTDGPRFGYVAFQAPHSPFHLPPDFSYPPLNYSDRAKFEYMVQSLDLMVGDMLSSIDLDRTYFVFVADNGTPTGVPRPDQSANKVKGTTFRDGVRVPLIVAGPGLAQGETDALVHVVDLLATLADLAGIRVPGHLELDSRSFAGALVDPERWTPERPFVYLETDTPGLPHDRAIVTDRYKLRNVDGSEELYDLLADPREETPLDLADYGALVAWLRAVLSDPSSAPPAPRGSSRSR